MLKTQRILTWMAGAALAVAAGVAPVGAAAGAETPAAATDVGRNLTGRWKAPEYKVSASSDLDVAVWGKGASKVRTVELTLEPGGDGILRIANSVVGPTGKVRPYSASVIEARLKVELPGEVTPGEAVMPKVTVVEAEERFLDDAKEHHKLEGLAVSFHMPASNSRILNIRYDTPQGTGSFGETLTRRMPPARTVGALPKG